MRREILVTYGRTADIVLGHLVDADAAERYQTSPTLASGDVQISKDGGSFSNVTNLPTQIGTTGCLTWTPASAELDAATVVLRFVDQTGTAEWADDEVVIVTEGDSSSEYGVRTNLDSSGNVNQVNALGTQAKADVNAEADTALQDYDGVVPADLPTNFGSMAIDGSGHVTAGTVNDKTGYSLSGVTFPTNFGDLAITATDGYVTAGTVNDKSGYSLSQSFPSNFDGLAIDGSGHVTAGTVGDKAGYSLAADQAVDVTKINGSASAASNLSSSALGIVVGAAATGTLSTTQMTTNLSEATDDHYNGRYLVWTSGALAGQATDITDYDGASKMLTFTSVTEAPNNGDSFVIV